MRFHKPWPGVVATLCIVFAVLLTEARPADAQSLRYWKRTVDAGKQIEFQWLNYDERTCKDNGYPKLVVEKAPKLGKLRTSQRRFTQQDGKCKGSRFSVLLVYYVAGRTRGEDRVTYVIDGRNNIRINLTITVK